MYRYPDNSSQQTLDGQQPERRVNLNADIARDIADRIGMKYDVDDSDRENTVSPMNILDYVYAVLHSPSYRRTYMEFLKIDFPRIPYPEEKETFKVLTHLGATLRSIHLFTAPQLEEYVTAYSEDGSNTITRKITQKDYELHQDQHIGRVWINDTQYFDNVPSIAWEFYIGGYQPAQKWLKDRYGKQLSLRKFCTIRKLSWC